MPSLPAVGTVAMLTLYHRAAEHRGTRMKARGRRGERDGGRDGVGGEGEGRLDPDHGAILIYTG